MKKLMILTMACCVLLAGCGETNEKARVEDNNIVKETEKPKETIKKDIADFCSSVDLVSSCVSIVLADSEEADFSDGDNCLNKAKDIYKNKIEKSQYDSVHINDIKETSYEILYECENLWNGIKNGEIGLDDYDSISDKQEEISKMCDELKSYLE